MQKMERFTQRARRVLALAQEEAERLQHSYIGTEHMLLGLMREEGGVAGRVLRDLGLDQRRVEELVERMTRAGQRSTATRLDLSPGTKKVLELAVDEARRMGHHYIGTEHLLLGLVRQSEGIAIDVFKRLNVAPEEVRRQTRRVLQESPVQPPGVVWPPPSPTPPASSAPSAPAPQSLGYEASPFIGQTLLFAGEEASIRGHRFVGVWHLLAAMLRHENVAGRILREFGLDPKRVETRLGPISNTPPSRTEDRDLTVSTTEILTYASKLARNLGDNYVGNEHLLFALTQQHEDIFEQLDIDPEQLLDILEAQFPKFSSSDRPQAPAPVKPEKISTSEPMDEKDIFRAIAEAETAGQPIALATVVRTEGSMPRHAGSKLLVYADGRIVGTVGGGAMEARVVEEAKTAIKEGKPRINTYTLNDLKAGDPGVCGGTADIFIDPLFVRPTLVVIGCGHVGKALAELAKWAGFRVIVSDDRGELCNPQHIPNMDEYIVTPPNAVHQHVELGPHTYVAALTRGLPIDIDLFPPLLQAEVPYLGLIGSRRRWALTTKELEARGFTKEQLARVRAPIGLELEAETPHEIAVSILAEIIMLRNGGTGKPMQWMGSAEAVSE